MGTRLPSTTDSAPPPTRVSGWAVWVITRGRAHVALPDHLALCGARLEDGPLRLATARARRCRVCQGRCDE